MQDNYFFTFDTPVVAYNDENFSLTFSDKSTGLPYDVTGWSNMTYKALSDKTTDVIEVAHAAMSRTSSGAGVTDTVVIPLASTDTDIDKGLYDHEFSITVLGQDRTIFRGTIKILERRAEIT